jgi:hypothetical protein
MLKTETVTYNGKEYIRTWSDLDVMIERDGALYEEAIDPADSGRTYVETDRPIVHDGEAEEVDYLAALERFGVQ